VLFSVLDFVCCSLDTIKRHCGALSRVVQLHEILHCVAIYSPHELNSLASVAQILQVYAYLIDPLEHRRQVGLNFPMVSHAD
jgi:hypothetical protein